VRRREPSEAEQRDPLDMTVRELLMTLTRLGGHADEWINIRDERYPYRRILRAIDSGESVEVCRVGRRLLMRREELNRWIEAHRITRASKKEKKKRDATPETDEDRSIRRSLERQGYRAIG